MHCYGMFGEPTNAGDGNRSTIITVSQPRRDREPDRKASNVHWRSLMFTGSHQDKPQKRSPNILLPVTPQGHHHC